MGLEGRGGDIQGFSFLCKVRNISTAGNEDGKRNVGGFKRKAVELLTKKM